MSKPRDQVLGDHKQIGKRFIPPFLKLLPNMDLVRWIDRILPELLWLGILNTALGYQRGAELAAAIGKAANSVAHHDNKRIFCFTSSFSSLDLAAQENVMRQRLQTSDLRDLRRALLPLIVHYPQCPLAFLVSTEGLESEASVDLATLKLTLNELFDRMSVPATFCQANALYIAFATGRLIVNEGLALAEFPKVEDYPDTEISKKIASGVRATITGMVGEDQKKWGRRWPDYFWNHGLELEGCNLDG